jgi:hypothetical protein
MIPLALRREKGDTKDMAGADVAEEERLAIVGSNEALLDASGSGEIEMGEGGRDDEVVYKVYKRRWFGLLQLVLLNVVVSWDVSLTLCLLCLWMREGGRLEGCGEALVDWQCIFSSCEASWR